MEEKERRKFKRVKKTLYVQCRPYYKDEPWSSVTTKDIGEAGMSFMANKEFKDEEIIEIKFTTFIQREPLILLAKVINRQECYKGTTWLFHAAFTHINETDKPVFRQYINIFLKESGKK